MPLITNPDRPRALKRAIHGLLLGVACSGPLMAAPLPPRQEGKSTNEQADAQQKLVDIRSKMEALGREQADTATQRDSANAELARQAAALATAARAVHETDIELEATQKDLNELQLQLATLKTNLDGQHAAIADLLRATYALGRGSDLRLLLGDEDVAQISRALMYSKYFQQDRALRVQELMTALAKLEQLQTAISTAQQAMEAIRQQRLDRARLLATQRTAQQKLASKTDAQYKDQAQRLAVLKQNAQALNELVAKLQKAIDDAAHAAKLAEAQAAAAREAAQKKHPGKSLPPSAIEVGAATANIRGNLPWPAAGVVNSYGNGVLIKAAGGSEIHAVARGKVIYAGFLRGYGMLLIVNHGNGWLSMYGNNETLLHGVGDQVEAGAALGTASPPTGVNSGAYFELRRDNQPVDPRSWLSQRH